jgi:hypothetical protein
MKQYVKKNRLGVQGINMGKFIMKLKIKIKIKSKVYFSPKEIEQPLRLAS